MPNALAAIAEGISTQLNANAQTQISVALSAIGLVLTTLLLQQSWGSTIIGDANDYYVDMLKSMDGNDPTAQTQAATEAVKDNVTKTNHMNQANQEAGILSNLIEKQKAQAQAAGSSLQQLIPAETPIIELLNFVLLVVAHLK